MGSPRFTACLCSLSLTFSVLLVYPHVTPSSHCFLLYQSDKVKGHNTSCQLDEEPTVSQSNGCCFTALGEDTRGRCSPSLHSIRGTAGTVTVQECRLVIDMDNPCLACNPDGRVASDCDRGLLEIKCPYTVANEGVTPLQAATDIKGFSCKQSITKQGTTELKCSHDYFYRI